MAPKDVWLEPLLAFILNSLFPYHKSSQKAPVKNSLNVCLDFMSPSKVKQSVLTMKEFN